MAPHGAIQLTENYHIKIRPTGLHSKCEEVEIVEGQGWESAFRRRISRSMD